VTPHGVAFDANGQILVVDVNAFGTAGSGSSGPGGVVRVDPRTGAQTVVSKGGYFKTPLSVAVEADGNILVADDDAFAGNHGGVIRVNPVTGAQSIVSQGGNFIDPYGIAVLPNKDILVADQDAFGGPTGMPCGNGVAGNGRGGIIKVNPTTGAQTIVSKDGNFCDADGAELAPNGGLYVADLTAFGGPGGVICVNPSTGTQYVISQKGSFSEPSDVAITPTNNLYVTDHNGVSPGGSNTPVVYKVDNATGAQTVLSYNGSFVRPEHIAVVPGLPAGPSSTPCGR
jgi:sugar lactone lactonase YvrE